MTAISRREFSSIALALATQSKNLFAASASASSIDAAIRDGMTRRKIPTVVAMAATADKITYTGAFGKRDAASAVDAKPDTIFGIASMTKAITTTAAMQLVEQGKLDLHAPASKYLPQLAKLDVLEGFDSAGQAILHPATKTVTLHHLMTHTSGFAYDVWDERMLKYDQTHGGPSGGVVAPLTPLIFEPGTRWQYGTGLDWTGRIVEAVSGLTLEQYMQRNILQPLGMKDTTFVFPKEKVDRLAGSYNRQANGELKAAPRALPGVPKEFNGGGGLYSTAPDYVAFMQMILNHGKGRGHQILQPKTVAMMTTNQIGDISAGKLKTVRPEISSDVDFHPGVKDGFTYGFLINTVAYPGRRSAGSLAWAGVENTYYWIDPKRSMCGVIMMQFFPFADSQAVALLGDFEKAVYAA